MLSPRSKLVHCTITRPENGAPVQGNVWLAMQPMLHTPVLCVRPLNDPIELIFPKPLEMPERDASGCGWQLVRKIRVFGGEEFAFKLEMIRLYPVTSQTSDLQLDDVVAVIREFKAVQRRTPLRRQKRRRPVIRSQPPSPTFSTYWPRLSAPTGLA